MPQDLTAVIPQILAQAVVILRQNAIMPRIVNTDYATNAATKGATVDIPVPSALQARDVVPANIAPNPPASNDLTPSKVQLTLSNWKEVPFVMTDKDLMEVMDGYQPRVLQEAVKAVANAIDSSILALYRDIPFTVGTAGTTPFASSLIEAQRAFRTLNANLVPRSDRRIVLDVFAEANAIGVPVLQKVNESGSSETLREGQISRAIGFDWYGDQNVPLHTGGATAAATYAVDNASGYLAGSTSVLIDNGAGALVSPAPIAGDVFTIAGNSTQYTVITYTPATTEGTLTFYPALPANIADNAALTFIGAHTPNLAFHRDAFAFASRPLQDLDVGGMIETISDPISGVTMRLEIVRQHKRTYFSLDSLWGVKTVRPELAVRIAG